MSEIECELCGKTFSKEKALNSHLNAKHKKAVIEKTKQQNSFKLNIKFSTIAWAAVFLVFLFAGNIILSSLNNTVQSVTPGSSEQVGLRIGNLAPDFSFTTVDGEQKRVSDFAAEGKPVIVEFGTTWCPHCRNDLVALRHVVPDYEDKVGYVFVGMDRQEGSALLRSFKERNNFEGTFAVPESTAMRTYNVTYTTTKFGIDKEGKIAFSGNGEEPDFLWRQKFESLLQ